MLSEDGFPGLAHWSLEIYIVWPGPNRNPLNIHSLPSLDDEDDDDDNNDDDDNSNDGGGEEIFSLI